MNRLTIPYEQEKAEVNLTPMLDVVFIMLVFFVVNGRPLSRGSLVPYLRALRAQNPDAAIVVAMAEGSIVRDTVSAVDAVRRTGFGTVPVTAWHGQN